MLNHMIFAAALGARAEDAETFVVEADSTGDVNGAAVVEENLIDADHTDEERQSMDKFIESMLGDIDLHTIYDNAEEHLKCAENTEHGKIFSLIESRRVLEPVDKVATCQRRCLAYNGEHGEDRCVAITYFDNMKNPSQFPNAKDWCNLYRVCDIVKGGEDQVHGMTTFRRSDLTTHSERVEATTESARGWPIWALPILAGLLGVYAAGGPEPAASYLGNVFTKLTQLVTGRNDNNAYAERTGPAIITSSNHPVNLVHPGVAQRPRGPQTWNHEQRA